MVEAAHHDGELVAAEARYRVGLSHAGIQAPCRLLEQPVANTVAQRVVDILEPVQIEVQERDFLAVTVCVPDLVFEAVTQHLAVGETGQRIEIGLIPDQFLGSLA